MGKLTEEDVYLANEPLIRQVCRQYRRNMESEDCMMAASEGFLEAIRCYQRGISSFYPYAVSCMRKQIQKEQKDINRIQRIESPLSLDRPVKPEEKTEAIGSVFYKSTGDFVSTIILREFLDSLNEELKLIALMYIDKYTSEEIMEVRKLSEYELTLRRKEICYLWEQYDPFMLAG